MTHPDEDTLLKQALDLLEGEEREEVTAHLYSCSSCRQKFQTLERETEMLGSLEADIPLSSFDMPSRWRMSTPRFAGIAAVLLFGFLSGYGFSLVSRPADVTVVPHYRATTVPTHTIQQFTVCESLDLL